MVLCENTVCLPGKEEMDYRLQYVQTLNPDSFFPDMRLLLLKHAGEEKTAEEIVEMLCSAISECVAGNHGVRARRAYDLLPLLIFELVDNASVSEAARLTFEETRAQLYSTSVVHTPHSANPTQEKHPMLHAMIPLPLHEEMERRLHEVDFDFFYRYMLYPKLLKKAGGQVTPEGLAMLMHFSVAESTIGMPREMDEKVCEKVPDFMKALIADELFVEEAKLIFDRVRQAAYETVK